MKRVAIIGGGSGAHTLLKVLKEYPLEISVIVPMVNSGGSTGVLRDEFQMFPSGDFRKCLSALASDSENEILNRLLNYRFKEGSSLAGHTFGNLMITALYDLLESEEEAIITAGKLLRTKGRVYASTLDDVQLSIKFDNGDELMGEAEFATQKDTRRRVEEVRLVPSANAYKKAQEAIVNSDLIVLGPSNLYRSIIPVLLVEGINEAIYASGANIMYVCNLTSIPGQSTGYTAKDHLDTVNKHLGNNSVNIFVANTKYDIKGIEEYQKNTGENMVHDDIRKSTSIRHVKDSFARLVTDKATNDKAVRHDPQKLSFEIFKFAKQAQ